MGIFGNFQFPSMQFPSIQSVGLVILSILVFIISGIVVFFVVLNKIQKKQYIHKINFAKEVNGRIYLIGEDYAKELTIPYTSIKIFYLKQRKTYSPKLTYDIGRNNYLILIGKGGEWTNTDLRYGADGVIELNDTLKPTRDYANENLKELIKRNWTDKNKDWWKMNSHYVFLIILGVIIIIGFIVMFSQVKKASGNLNGASQNYKEASQIYAQAQKDFMDFLKEQFKTSGVIQAQATGGG